MTAAQVQPAALILHELAANAKRHGALSVTTGLLSIEWQGEPVSRELHIRWSESGGPAPASKRFAGHGQTMIDAIARRQLHGRVDYAWDESGLVADVTIPWGNIVG